MSRIDVLRELLQRGDYDLALKEHGLIADLTKLAIRASHEEECLDAASLLSELYDQTSQYDAAAKVIDFGPRTCREALQALVSKVRSEMDRKTADGNNYVRPSGRGIRALAMFCLAHAISLHRRTGDRGISLEEACEIGIKICNALNDLELLGFHFMGSQGFAHYWIGRFFSLQRKTEEAEKHFDKSIHYVRANLESHFRDHHSGEQPGHNGTSPRDCRRCQALVSVSNYLLASNTGFGIAALRLREGKATEALTLLRPSRILLEGCSGDRYRQGYVRLLIARAQRIQYGLDAKKLKNVVDLLGKAKNLFGTESDGNAAHKYYAARTDFQLSIAFLQSSMDESAPMKERRTAILRAIQSFCAAAAGAEVDQQDLLRHRYADLDLKMKLHVLACNIACQLVTMLYIEGWDNEKFSTIRRDFSSLGNVQRFSRVLGQLDTSEEKNLGKLHLARTLLREAWNSLESANSAERLLYGDRGKKIQLHLLSVLWGCTSFELAKRALQEILSSSEDNQSREGEIKAAERTLEKAKSKLGQIKIDISSLTMVVDRSKDWRARAALHVAMANIYLHEGNQVAARRHLGVKYSQLEDKVETKIIRDRAARLKRQLSRDESELVIEVYEDGEHLSLEGIQRAVFQQIVHNARASGVSLEELASRLRMNLATFKKKAKIYGLDEK